MLKISTLLGSAILLVTASNTLFAQQTKPVKLWSGDLEFGYLNTSGNTEETTVTGKADINREKGDWRNKLLFDSLNSIASGDRSAEKYFLSNRLAYQFNQHDYAFGYASFDDDRFSGFDYQATVAAGYGRRLLNNETMRWDAEIGPGYRISRVNEDSPSEDSEDVILRLYTNYSWDITDTANFSQLVNIESGDENTISKSITALKLKVIGNFALKLSYTIKYTEKLPNGNKHADIETAITAAYSF